MYPHKKLAVQRKPALTTHPKPQPATITTTIPRTEKPKVLLSTRDPLGNARIPPTTLSTAQTRARSRTLTPAHQKKRNEPPPPVSHAKTTSTRLLPELPHTRITPSPDLPPIDPADTPAPAPTIRLTGVDVLELGTPEVERWVEAGRASEDRERCVAFDEQCRVGRRVDDDSDDHDDDDDDDSQRERNMSLQLSPQRSPAHASTVPASGAQDLLRTLVRDAMHEMQRETRAGLTGLHLDLLRAGRGWRRELRAVMAEGGYGPGGELERLREENRQLRAENERLRRGV